MRLAIAVALLAVAAVVLALALAEELPVAGGLGPGPPRAPAHAISAEPRGADPPSVPETDTAPSASPAFTR